MGIFKSSQKNVVVAGGSDFGFVRCVGGGEPTIGVGWADLYVVLIFEAPWNYHRPPPMVKLRADP